MNDSTPSEEMRAANLPLISCVMPTYGRPEFVHESLAMFLAQDYVNKELLIVNDCPGQTFEGEFPQVRIINCDERFPTLGEKRNFAIRQAAGDWIAVWDDDDIYLPWRLSFSMQEIAAFETPLYRPHDYWAYWGESNLHDNQAIREWISHPLVIFHRDLWETAKGYPRQTLNEDSGLFRRMQHQLRTGWVTYPISNHDRFMILRCASKYSHTSIKGGKLPPNTSPGVFRLSPRPIQDDILRAATESLITARNADAGAVRNTHECANSVEELWQASRTRTFLDDLQPIEQSVGYGALGRHGQLGYAEKQVVVAGQPARHSLSAHAPATLTYHLGGQYTSFESYLAMNDDVIGRETSADFIVVVDGETKACVTDVTPGDGLQRVSVRVDHARRLELRTRTNRWDHCHSVWIEPTLRMGDADEKPQTITDCLKRAEITVPAVPKQQVDLCVATVVSPGHEEWLQTFLASLTANGNCPDALIAVFCFGGTAEIDRLLQQYGATPIDCAALADVDMACKSVLYSVGRFIRARKYLCFDVDMLVVGSLQDVSSSLDVLPNSSILVCRDAANIPTLGDALTGLYESSPASLKRMAGASAVEHLNYSLVINDGFFAATRTAINAVDELIRDLPDAAGWVSAKPSTAPWRNQFVFNLALAKLGTAVELDATMNWQLNQQSLQLDGESGSIQTTSHGKPIKVIHFNGGGREKYPELREAFLQRSPPVPTHNAPVRSTSTPDGVNGTIPRFVICSTLRTGSHMLATALNAHPNLEVAGEILVRPVLFGVGQDKELPDDELSIIDEAYEKLNGCIIHRKHTRAMQHIGKVPDLKVIFLTRKNWLAQLASEIRARQTNIWHFAPDGANYLSNDGTSRLSHLQSPFTIPLCHCFEFLREQNQLELLALEHLSDCPLLPVTYEDLQAKWNVTLKGVLGFLELADVPLAPATLKQGIPVRQAVANYEEIRRCFVGSRWDLSLCELDEGVGS
ncbi:MAG: NPCBM/NEW2 domain-containing protein [Planctomycetaceae bacterium]